MNFGGSYGGFRERSEVEDGLCLKNEEEEGKKILVKSGAGVAHGRAIGHMARANPLEFWLGKRLQIGTAMPMQAQAVPVYWSHRVKFF